MTVVVSLSQVSRRVCSVCRQPIRSDAAQAFVFLEGSEDPLATFAHGACIRDALSLGSAESARDRRATGPSQAT